MIKEMEPYFIEFREDDVMKDKNYLLDYIVKGENCRPIIVITHNEYIFLANDGI